MLDYGKTEIRVGCYAEYLHINKYTFGARENIYYLLSLIHYLLSKNIFNPAKTTVFRPKKSAPFRCAAKNEKLPLQ